MSLVMYLFSWRGRIGRLQWWLGGLVQAVILFMVAVLVIAGANAKNLALIVPSVLLFLMMLWFGIGLSIKRLHDHNKSGLWFFIYMIPFVGSIWQLIECGLMRGTHGDNDYGPDPRFRFNVSEDIEALIAERDRGSRISHKTAMPQAPISAPMKLAPASAGPPVFGKRV